MGVYIANMAKPSCCGKCILQDGEMCFAIDDGGDGLSLFSLEDLRDFCIKRRDDCPLEEVDLVRCKECKRCEERTTLNGLSFLYCLKMEVSVGSDQYCYWGERRNNE